MSRSEPARETRETREMSITTSEFFRTLPSVLRGERLEIDRQRRSAIVAAADLEDRRRVEISLSPERERRLGALSLPVLDVEFRFRFMSEDDVRDFRSRFETHFRRGGG